MQKRKRADVDMAPSRRSTNACRRCKDKKIKCHFGPNAQPSTCTPCAKASAECEFDVAPDGIPRGADYIKELESKVASLEADLRSASAVLSPARTHQSAPASTSLSPATQNPSQCINALTTLRQPRDAHPLGIRRRRGASFASSPHSRLSISSTSRSSSKKRESISLPNPTWINLQSTTTIFNILHSGPSAAQVGSLPGVPTGAKADEYVQTVFFYTQARYCIVDWVRVHQWNQDRERVCKATKESNVEDQTAAYFTWIIYAIGAQFVRGSEQLSIGYCARALQHLGTVLAQQNLSAVQALLTLMQYQFRAPGGPSIWHLVGVTLRLCVELGYHRKITDPVKLEEQDAYTLELQKRFFWCTYCFDRYTESDLE
ncbi:hypothetical protein K4F52_004777 [Lecanicillium sp. MT-2017a]|nr:hypothetical protein K4F52_004777 [Lecanicillium sp. MT-2017a]